MARPLAILLVGCLDARAVGVELDPALAARARENVRRAGVADRAEIVQGDMFETDLRDATVVTLYLLEDLNARLRPVLLALRPGTRIVSHTFSMVDWKPDREEQVLGETVYLWTVPAPRPPASSPRKP